MKNRSLTSDDSGIESPAGRIFSLACLVIVTAAIFLTLPGCASRNVNPPSARENTGYVDFYCDPSEELWWDIQNLETHKTVFSELKPIPGGMVRLAFVPGRYKLAVSFLNRIILRPTAVEVEVKDGMVTPVRVSLVESGTATVSSRDTYRGSTIYGRYGRSTKIQTSEDAVFRVDTEVQGSIPYALKAQTPYAAAFVK